MDHYAPPVYAYIRSIFKLFLLHAFTLRTMIYEEINITNESEWFWVAVDGGTWLIMWYFNHVTNHVTITVGYF